MKPGRHASRARTWQLLLNVSRSLARNSSVWSVVLLVALLMGVRDLGVGGLPRDARPRAIGRGPMLERSVVPSPAAAFMQATGGRIDGTLARHVMRNAPIIEGTRGHLVVDTTMRISPDLVRELAGTPYVRDLSNEMERIVEELKGALTALDANADDVSYAGIGLGEGYIGVNINRTLFSVGGRNSILVNPYRIAEEIETWIGSGLPPADAPSEFSGRLVSAILHEIAHQSARGHDETFAAALTRLYGTSITAASRSFQRLEEEIDEAAYQRIVSDLVRLRSQWGGRDILASSGDDGLDGSRPDSPSRPGK